MARTTIDINPEYVEKVQEITGEPSKGRALDRVMEDFIRRDAVKRLLASRGRFNIKRTSEKWEAAELKAMSHGHPRQ